eukprot:1483682-Amphidinium_carterae.1
MRCGGCPHQSKAALAVGLQAAPPLDVASCSATAAQLWVGSSLLSLSHGPLLLPTHVVPLGGQAEGCAAVAAYAAAVVDAGAQSVGTRGCVGGCSSGSHSAVGLPAEAAPQSAVGDAAVAAAAWAAQVLVR